MEDRRIPVSDYKNWSLTIERAISPARTLTRAGYGCHRCGRDHRWTSAIGQAHAQPVTFESTH